MRRIYTAVTPEPALTSATLSARSTHPTEQPNSITPHVKKDQCDLLISFPTPAESTTMPTVVSNSLSSVRIRQSTGKAVIEKATPAKSMKYVNLMLSLMNCLYRGTESPAPMPKGSTIPARATVADSRAFFLITVLSISSPTRKRKRHKPMLAVRLRNGLESEGNMCSVKPGMRPVVRY